MQFSILSITGVISPFLTLLETDNQQSKCFASQVAMRSTEKAGQTSQWDQANRQQIAINTNMCKHKNIGTGFWMIIAKRLDFQWHTVYSELSRDRTHRGCRSSACIVSFVSPFGKCETVPNVPLSLHSSLCYTSSPSMDHDVARKLLFGSFVKEQEIWIRPPAIREESNSIS